MSETFEISSEEKCGDNIGFQDGILDIPEGIQIQISRIHDETTQLHREHLTNILTNYIRSNIHISSGNNILDELIGNEIFLLVVTAMQEGGFSLNDIDIQEGRGEILRAATQKFYDNYPEQYQAYYTAGNFDIDIGGARVSLEHYLLPIISGENIVAGESFAPLTSIIPPPRPNFHPEYIQASREYGINQYTLLLETGFSPLMESFLREDFFPRVLGENIEITNDHVSRIQKFLCFLIDLETSGGTQLINRVSTATGYTQTLNEEGADRRQGRFNSIDTRLRTALMFYNDDRITRGSRNGTLNIPEETQEAQWIGDLWRYNEAARDMLHFSFETELRLTLIYLATQNPEALNLILTGNESEQLAGARLLYHTHHTNVDGQGNTSMVMEEKLGEHYG